MSFLKLDWYPIFHIKWKFTNMSMTCHKMSVLLVFEPTWHKTTIPTKVNNKASKESAALPALPSTVSCLMQIIYTSRCINCHIIYVSLVAGLWTDFHCYQLQHISQQELDPWPTQDQISSTKSLLPDLQELEHKNLVEISTMLKWDDLATECHKIIVYLFVQFLDVDQTVAILPIKKLSTLNPIWKKLQISGNWTIWVGMCIWKEVHIPFGLDTMFPANCTHPEPWLVFCLASTKNTSYILQFVLVKYEWVNGCNLRVKLCQSYNSLTRIMFPFLYNPAHIPLLTTQLSQLMDRALSAMIKCCILDRSKQGWYILEFSLWSNNWHLPYQANIKEKKFDAFTSQNKMIHLERRPYLPTLHSH